MRAKTDKCRTCIHNLRDWCKKFKGNIDDFDSSNCDDYEEFISKD